MNVQALRKEFLDDTAKHFNSANLGIHVSYGGCSYVLGCAIGRHLPMELRETLDALEEPHVAQPATFALLPENLQVLGRDFLGEVQNLHDNASYWDLDGLDENGFKEFIKIQNKYC